MYLRDEDIEDVADGINCSESWLPAGDVQFCAIRTCIDQLYIEALHFGAKRPKTVARFDFLFL
jgi:hypothetical protein